MIIRIAHKEKHLFINIIMHVHSFCHSATHMTFVFCLKGCIRIDETFCNLSMTSLCSNVKRGKLT